MAASNFTFTATLSPEIYSCHILRFTTTSSFSSPVLATATDDDGTTTTNPTFTVNFDAVVIDSIVVAFFARTGTSTSVSNYTFSGTNPTWSERYDLSDGSMSIAIATAPTTLQTSFTTFELDTVTSDSGNSVILLSVAAVSNATPDVAHQALTIGQFGPEGSNTGTADVSHITISPTQFGLESKDSSDNTQWSNVDKPSTTWTNPNK